MFSEMFLLVISLIVFLPMFIKKTIVYFGLVVYAASPKVRIGICIDIFMYWQDYSAGMLFDKFSFSYKILYTTDFLANEQ